MTSIKNGNLVELSNIHYDLLCNKFNFSISKRLNKSLEEYKLKSEFINKEYYKLLEYIKNNLKEIITGKPETLDKQKKELIKLSMPFEFTKNQKLKTNDQQKVLEDLNYIFNYKTFSSNGFRNKKNKKIIDKFYSGNILVENINLSVCPYCNRNTIYNLKYTKNRTSELDHFYPQSKYPYFALSFYNLIPSCKVCNQIKLDNDDKIYINPYDKRFDFNKNMKFSLKIKDSTFYHLEDGFKLNCKFDKDISIDEKSRIKNNIKDFKLYDLYQNHKDIPLELIQKSQIYNDSYIDELYTKYEGTLFKNREDLLRLITCGYINDEDIDKRPLSKLIKDILEELGLI